jgi:hypothetical protein
MNFLNIKIYDTKYKITNMARKIENTSKTSVYYGYAETMLYSINNQEWCMSNLEFIKNCFINFNTIIYGKVYIFTYFTRNNNSTMSLRRMIRGSKMNVVHLVEWGEEYEIINIPYASFLGKII